MPHGSRSNATVNVIRPLLASVALATPSISARAEVVSVIGATLRVHNPDGPSQVLVTAKFLGDTTSLYTSELYLDAPTFLGPIFNNQTTPVNHTANLGTFIPETVLFIRNQSFFIPNPGSPATNNFGFFTGDGTLPLNPDRLPHAVFTWDTSDPESPVTVGFEDQFGGGDFDFNDAVYQFTNVRVGTVTMALTPIGLGETFINHEESHVADLLDEYTNDGTLENEGSLTNYGTANNNGTVNNQSSFFNDRPSQFNNNAGGHFNNFDEVRNFGEVTNQGTITNADEMTNSGTVDNIGDLVNEASGTLTNSASSLVENVGDFFNSGTVNNAGQISNSGVVENTGTTIVQALGQAINQVEGAIENLGTWMNEGKTQNKGTINNSGNISNVGEAVNEASGIVKNTADGAIQNLNKWLNLEGASLDNEGGINNFGTIENAGSVVNKAGGLVQNQIEAAIKNVADWVNEPGSQTQNDGAITNSGSFTIESGAEVSGDGTYTQDEIDAITTIMGDINQATLDFHAGLVKGIGKVKGALNAGEDATVSPGNSPGTLTVDGDFTLDGGTLEIELVSPTSHDLLDVSGMATFDGGTIDFVFTQVPNLGDSFTFLTADGGINGFHTLEFDFLGDAGGNSFLIDVTGNAVTLSIVPEPVGAALLGAALIAFSSRPRRKRYAAAAAAGRG